MTWLEVKERCEEDPMTPVIVLFSSTEQHGYHLPLNTDAVSTGYIWWNAAKNVRKDVKPVLTPMMPYGNEWEHMGFPGTISLSTRTLTQLTKEIIRSLYLNAGFRKFAIVPGCGGQAHVTSFRMAICDLYEELGPNIILFIGGGESAFSSIEEQMEINKKLGFSTIESFTAHGGEGETSTALFLQSEDVNFEQAVDTIVPNTAQPILPEWVNLPEGTDWDWFKRFNPHVNWAYPRLRERGPQVGPVGSIGYATRASALKGKIATQTRIEWIERFLRWFKTLKITPKKEPARRYGYKA
jgi:creatinine amidohydrolase